MSKELDDLALEDRLGDYTVLVIDDDLLRGSGRATHKFRRVEKQVDPAASMGASAGCWP